MSYQATAINVMIASPSDVSTERQHVQDAIREWNTVHSQERGVVLMPISWDTHSIPEMGERPQAIINRQVLDNCDLLVAVFWTRIGSPTGQAPSGTAEEIRRHVAAKKPAMIYFSNAPVRPDSVDPEQYAPLKAFRAECEKEGLIAAYEDAPEFKAKFSQNLAQKVRDCFCKDAQAPAPVTPPSPPAVSDEAGQLLVAAASDDGLVVRIRFLGGTRVEAGGRPFAEERNARSVATWESAIRELVDARLLEERGTKGEMFAITKPGYELADRLSTQAR